MFFLQLIRRTGSGDSAFLLEFTVSCRKSITEPGIQKEIGKLYFLWDTIYGEYSGLFNLQNQEACGKRDIEYTFYLIDFS